MGEIRSPGLTWALIPLSFGLYLYYFLFTVGNELRTFLGREEINPALDIVLAFATCGLYAYFLMRKYGRYLAEAQARAGMPEPKDEGVNFLLYSFLCWFGVYKLQLTLNQLWQHADAGPGV